MSNIVSESMNKGVPVYTPINIRYNDLVQVSDNSEIVMKVLDKSFQNYMEYLRGFGLDTDIEIFRTMMIDMNIDTLERILVHSPSGFFSTLIFNLNVNKACSNADSISMETFDRGQPTEIFKKHRMIFENRIDVLKKINSVDELRREFPMLYNKYQLHVDNVNQVKQIMVNLSKMNRSQKRAVVKQLTMQCKKKDPNFDFEKEMKKATTFSLEKFKAEYVNTFNILVENGSKIVDYLMSSPIDLTGITGIDKDKLEFFFASQFLSQAEKADEKDKQDFLYYVANYFKENNNANDKKLKITIGKAEKNFHGIQIKNKGGLEITPYDLYQEYRELLIANPELRAIDFSHLDFNGLNAREVKEFMDEYLKDLSANWEFLDPDDKKLEEDTIKSIRNSGRELSEEERIFHQERLFELYMEKKEFYDSSDPYFRIKGKNTFDGYIGYIYSNGRVVLDKFYEDSTTMRLADGQAIYAMGVDEFYELSRLSKTELIRNKLCNRYIHKGDWQERVRKNELEAQGNIDSACEVKKMIKTGNLTTTGESAN